MVMKEWRPSPIISARSFCLLMIKKFCSRYLYYQDGSPPGAIDPGALPTIPKIQYLSPGAVPRNIFWYEHPHDWYPVYARHHKTPTRLLQPG